MRRTLGAEHAASGIGVPSNKPKRPWCAAKIRLDLDDSDGRDRLHKRALIGELNPSVALAIGRSQHRPIRLHQYRHQVFVTGKGRFDYDNSARIETLKQIGPWFGRDRVGQPHDKSRNSTRRSASIVEEIGSGLSPASHKPSIRDAVTDQITNHVGSSFRLGHERRRYRR